jgi:hypothetical protein
MSCLLVIGFQPNANGELGLRRVLNAQAFQPVDQTVHEYAKELAAKAKNLNPKSQWFIAVDQQGQPDFEIAYDLPNALNGRLGGIIGAFEQSPATTTLELFFYDLGTNETRSCGEAAASELRRTLSKLYEKGAPVGSVYHKFSKAMT